MVRKPHQAAYWEVTLARNEAAWAARRAWCRDNLAVVGGRLPYLFPRAVDLEGSAEVWRFAHHGDAVLFGMVWAGETTWQDR
jgi:hypothetical protein